MAFVCQDLRVSGSGGASSAVEGARPYLKSLLHCLPAPCSQCSWSFFLLVKRAHTGELRRPGPQNCLRHLCEGHGHMCGRMCEGHGQSPPPPLSPSPSQRPRQFPPQGSQCGCSTLSFPSPQRPGWEARAVLWFEWMVPSAGCRGEGPSGKPQPP